jgi:hypothetical protein
MLFGLAQESEQRHANGRPDAQIEGCAARRRSADPRTVPHRA